MADVLNFHDAFIDGLRDTYDAERQIARALPMLAEACKSLAVRNAVQSHLDETGRHIDRLEQIFRLLGESARGAHCQAVAAIFEECISMLAEEPGDEAMDAHLIASMQRIEQYEIAAYTTLVAWADGMHLSDVSGLLRLTLAEETAADQALSTMVEARYIPVANTHRRSRI
jgi:ferritin-like metal-binding protein YciE